jgi:ATP-dependent DNA ligase
MTGDQVYDLLEQIAATSSRNEKEDLIRAHAYDELFRYVLYQAYNPFITFGLKPDRPTAEDRAEVFVDMLYWDGPQKLLHQLAIRQLSGNEARDMTIKVFQHLTPKSADVLWRVISKDLKAGFTDGTVNRVIPGHIPVFEVMLAHKYEEKRIKSWPVAAEPKMDGVRVICIVDKGQAHFKSRNGKPFPAMDHMAPAIVKFVENAWSDFRDSRFPSAFDILGGEDGPSVVLEGEMMTDGGFNKTSGDVRRKSTQATDAYYCLFDALSLKEFQADDFLYSYEARRQYLEMIVEKAAGDAPIKLLPSKLCSSHEQLMEYFEEVRSTGGEGLIVKPLKGGYQKKRSYNWLKIKAEETEDLIVIDAFEGEPNTKYEGKLGGVIVDRNGVEVRVGGGISDAQREEWWQLYIADVATGTRTDGALLGRMIEVEFHEVTPDGSLRHPRFKRFRDDKRPAIDKLAA